MPQNQPILTTDRVLYVGMTGSGKTFLADKLLRSIPRVVVIDSKPSDAIRAWGLKDWATATRRALDDGSPCRIRVPPELDIEEYDALYRQLYKYTNYVLYIDEVVETTSRQGTRDFRRLYKLGRERGVGVQGGVQEPVYLPSVCFSQAEWTLMFTLPVGVHRERMAKTGIGDAALYPLAPRWYYLYRQGWAAPLLHPPWPAPAQAASTVG